MQRAAETQSSEPRTDQSIPTVWQQKDRDLGSELGYADNLGALERYPLEDLHRPEVLRMSHIWASPP